jgi:hypothetical protein
MLILTLRILTLFVTRDEINSLVEGSHAAADSGIHQLAEGVQLAIDLLG